MSTFHDFKVAVSNQFDLMSQHELFVTDTTKDDLWDMYLGSFPEGSNPIFRERTEHDCQCCKQFIRAGGNVVAIIDGELVSIWDVDIGGDYQVVANALSNLVKSSEIANVYRHYEHNLGTDRNHQQTDGGDVIEWEHFHYRLPTKFVITNGTIDSFRGDVRANKDVLQRSLEEISASAAEIVLELIGQNTLYRGEEFKSAVELFASVKAECDRIDTKENKAFYLWNKSLELGVTSKFRNTAIGTLLVDISSGMPLVDAVNLFGSKMDGYKVCTSVATPGMIKAAQEEAQKEGFEDSLYRRYAVTDDVKINNVLFADREAKRGMGVFDELLKSSPDKRPNLDKVEEIGVEKFIETILPKAEKLSVMFENPHASNLMSLVAPVHDGAKGIFKWGNNFSWAYNGEKADSMRERVKKAGGNVDGVLRFSIQWNDGDSNQNDFDAHCHEPNGNLIHYPKKGEVQRSSGMLDVDITHPGRDIAVENITWTDKSKMFEGEYTFLVHNFSHNGGRTGFTAEIEYEGKIYSYTYKKELRQDEKVVVAKIRFCKENGIEFIETLPNSESSKEVWGISTHKFHTVKMVMNSPNHWDGEQTGNRHWFFILEDCINPEEARGFFNEFLNNDLMKHRKVFEMLGSKLKTEHSSEQLSGLGFSSTQRNHLLCKVSGSFNRTLKINF